MNSTLSLALQWSGVFLGFLVLLYMLKSIKGEQVAYEESAVAKNFHELILLIPSWWTATHEEKDLLRFQRTDTKYELVGQIPLL